MKSINQYDLQLQTNLHAFRGGVIFNQPLTFKVNNQIYFNYKTSFKKKTTSGIYTLMTRHKYKPIEIQQFR